MTEDIDLVVGVDLSELPRLTQPLLECGWRKDRRWERRWISGGGREIADRMGVAFDKTPLQLLSVV
jgi:hypothetical protein